MPRYKLNFSNIFYKYVIQIPSGVLQLNEALDLERFKQALIKATGKLPIFSSHFHECFLFRCSYLESKKDPADLPLEYEYFEDSSDNFQQEKLQEYARITAHYDYIPLKAKYLYKIKILSFENKINYVFLTWQHMLCDGEAVLDFFNEIFSNYYGLPSPNTSGYTIENRPFLKILTGQLNILQKAFFYLKFSVGAVLEALEAMSHFFLLPKRAFKQTDDYALDWEVVPHNKINTLMDYARRLNKKSSYLSINAIYSLALHEFRRRKNIRTRFIKVAEVISLNRFVSTPEKKVVGNYLATIFPKIRTSPQETFESVLSKLYRVYHTEWHEKRSFISNIFLHSILFNILGRLVPARMHKYLIRASVPTDTLLTNLIKFHTPLEENKDILHGNFFGVIPCSYRMNLSLAVTNFRDNYTFAFSYNPTVLKREDFMLFKKIFFEKIEEVTVKAGKELARTA